MPIFELDIGGEVYEVEAENESKLDEAYKSISESIGANKQQPTESTEQTIAKDTELYKTQEDSLNASLELKKKSIQDSDFLDDEQKDVLIKRSVAEYEQKRAKAEDDAYSKYIKENKQVPQAVTKDTKDYKKSFSKNLNDFIDEVNNIGSNLISPVIGLAVNSAERASSAIGATVETAINASGEVAKKIGIPAETNLEYYSNNLDRLRAEGERLNRTLDPKGKAAMSPMKAMDFMASIAIPFNVTTPAKMLALEGLVGYMFEYSDTEDIGKAVGQGVLQSAVAGAGAVVAGEIAALMNHKGADRAVNYLWDKFEPALRTSINATDEMPKEKVINAVSKRWSKIMVGDGSQEDKVRAIIDTLGDSGTAFKKAAKSVVDTANEKIVDFPKAQRIQGLRAETKPIADIEGATKALGKEVGLSKDASASAAEELIWKMRPEGSPISEVGRKDAQAIFAKKMKQGEIGKIYDGSIKALKAKYTGSYNIDGELVGNINQSLTTKISRGDSLTTAESNLADALEGEMTMDKLLMAKKESTNIIGSTNDATLKGNAVKMRSAVDDVLRDTLSKDEYLLTRNIDEEWGRRVSISGKKGTNQLGAKLMEFANGRKTFDATLENLDALNTGNIDFKQLEKVIGTKNMAKVETGIIDNMLNKDIDDVSWGIISKSLNKMGFVSKEGRELKKVINEYDKVFSADNVATVMNSIKSEANDSFALTADLAEKLKYYAASSLWKKGLTKINPTKSGKELRAINDIGNILGGRKVYVKGVEIPASETREVVRESIKAAYKSQIQAIYGDAKASQIDDAVEEAVDRGMSNLGLKTGGKPTKPKTPTEGTGLETLTGTKKVDRGMSNLGLNTGGKPTKK